MKASHLVDQLLANRSVSIKTALELRDESWYSSEQVATRAFPQQLEISCVLVCAGYW